MHAGSVEEPTGGGRGLSVDLELNPTMAIMGTTSHKLADQPE